MIESQPKPEWFPISREGTRGVEGRVLLSKDGLFIANLRFAENATIDEHSAPHEIDVICIVGSGYTSIGQEIAPLKTGQTVRWTSNIDHCLWTENSVMETIMVERYYV